MTPEILWIVAAILGLAVGFVLGRMGRGDMASTVESTEKRLQAVASELAAGRNPRAGPDAPPGVAEICRAVDAHWVTRNQEREQALREALGRMAAFLREGVRDPLRDSLSHSPEAQREAIETAVGAVQDLEFFLREPLTPDETHNLIPVVQRVTREFTQDWEISVRFRSQQQPVRAHIHEGSFMDAVYLLLHNAGQFGGEKTVDVEVTEDDGRARVVIRDQGPGFTPEALERAHDLFFTTTETGLGLGIPFAKKIVESFGGSIELENLEGGGAEVRLFLPSD